MTRTTTKTPAQTAPASSATVELIDPATAVLDVNIRTVPVLSMEFVEQIRTEGVRVPVLARRGDDGTVHVWDGQRRLLAAREAGLTSILAIFGTTDAGNIARITDQLTSFNRDDLTPSDRITAYEQLTLEGVSVERIAKTTGASKEDVAASLTVGKSEAAKQAMDMSAISLDVALYVAEFDGDQDAIDTIMADADDPAELVYIVQSLRDDRAITKRREALLADYAAQGITTFTKRWSPDEFTTIAYLTDADDDADERPALDPETHTSCPGHALSVHVNGLQEGDVETFTVCTQPELHHPLHRTYGTRTTSNAPAQTAEEVETEAEARRVERRRLIANNKAWDTAATVRAGFLAKLITRKALPKNAAAFVAETLTKHRWDVANDNGQQAAKDMLGVTTYDGLATLVEKTPTKAGHVSLAVALSARESRTSRESWRHPNDADKSYLLQLETWGHHLSAVERIAAGYPEVAEEQATAEGDTE